MNYIQRAMVNIKAAQSKIIADYASSCMADVQDCYNQQNTQITSWSSAANVQNIYNIMTGACYNVALTCGYAIFAYDEEMGLKVENSTNKELTVIEGVSNIFYQSFFCPENSEYAGKTKSDADDADNYVNELCKCKDGYSNINGACLLEKCDGPMEYWYKGECRETCPRGTYKNTDPDERFCVTSCESDEYKDNDNRACIKACPSSAPYVQNDACVSSCNSDLVIVDDGTTKTCAANCPDGEYLDGRNCVQSCDVNKYTDIVHKKCVVECSADLVIVDDGTTKKCAANCPGGTSKCPTNSKCVVCKEDHACYRNNLPLKVSENGVCTYACSAGQEANGDGICPVTGMGVTDTAVVVSGND